jgi:putative ABC transport system permease protein
MLPPRFTPLAWFNLTYETRRLITAIAGVTFAVLLMFMFKGFENALYDSQVQLLKLFNGEIIIINRLKTNLFVPEQFARRRLYQAAAFEGVTAVYPIYIADGRWKNPQTQSVRLLRVLAFNPKYPVLLLPGIVNNLEALKRPWTAVMDEKSRPEAGVAKAGIVTELSEQQIHLVGTFKLGTDFAAGNGNLVMSDQNFVRYFGNLGPESQSRSLSTVDIGLLQLAPDINLQALVQALRQQLPKDVVVLTKDEFVQKELHYWRNETNIGFVFMLLTVMSFVVGIILSYQILYTDIAEHQTEYATMKAIGYSNLHLFSVVFQEASLIAVMGFVPGYLISLGLFHLTTEQTGLLMQMTLGRGLSILIATFLMCLISGAIAVHKIQAADPAEVFG